MILSDMCAVIAEVVLCSLRAHDAFATVCSVSAGL